jgi:hypothetical protein
MTDDTYAGRQLESMRASCTENVVGDEHQDYASAGSRPSRNDVRTGSLAQEGQPMIAITIMSPTPRFILYFLAVVLFFLSGIGFRPLGDRVSLIGLGLAAAVFPFMWDSLAGL